MPNPKTILTKQRDGLMEKIYSGYLDPIGEVSKKMVCWLHDESDNHHWNDEGGLSDGNEELLDKAQVERGIDRYSYDVYTYRLYTIKEALEKFDKEQIRNSPIGFI